MRGDHDRVAEWRRIADEIHADICANGVDIRGVFTQHYETTALDASLAIVGELTEDDLVLRYRVEETDDGFSGEEGSFIICSFWLVSALTEI